jgi:hypothetical protein
MREVIVPAEGNRAPFADVAMELEILERELSDGFQKRLLMFR